MRLHDSVVASVEVTWGTLANACIIYPDAPPILAGFPAIGCQLRCTIGLIVLTAQTTGHAVPALLKKASVSEKNESSPSVL